MRFVSRAYIVVIIESFWGVCCYQSSLRHIHAFLNYIERKVHCSKLDFTIFQTFTTYGLEALDIIQKTNRV